MKLLFVGEGPTDVGSPGFALPPRPATGVIFILSKKICPSISTESFAYYWRELQVLNREKKGSIDAAKVAQAIFLAARHGCDGTVFVLDADRHALEELERGVERGLKVVGSHPAVVGVAVKTIEAWILGTPTGLATVLKKTVDEITQHYKPHSVEDMNPRSGKGEKRSKELVAKIAESGHRDDDSPFREAVAENADLNELMRHCKEGFKPFAKSLLETFGSPPTN
jgi:hypothetical protein